MNIILKILEVIMDDLECPSCGALNDVSTLEEYEISYCWACREDYEYHDGILDDDF